MNTILTNNPELKNAMFTAEKYNWMRDAIVAMQRYYVNDVQTHILQLANRTTGIDDNNSQNNPGGNLYSIQKINNLVNGTPNNVTLATATWAGNSAPFTYTVEVSGVTVDNNVDVSLATSATLAQAKLWAKAMVMNATQSNGSITLKAYGKKPTANIPITITVHE